MRKSSLLLLATAFTAMTAVSPIVYADPAVSSGSTMSGGMMGRGMMGGGMMGQKSGMMGGCNAMMHGDSNRSGRPNEQWRGR